METKSIEKADELPYRWFFQVSKCERGNCAVDVSLSKPLTLQMICQDNLGAFSNTASQSMSTYPT